MDILVKTVIGYLESNDQFAMQIDGEWGTGKTHFVKTILFEEIRNKQYKPVYLSVFGFNNLESFKKNLRYQIVGELYTDTPLAGKLNKAKKTAETYQEEASSILGVFNLDALKGGAAVFNSLLDGHFDRKMKEDAAAGKIVVFIDDLERVSSSINLIDLLGFIQSELLETLGLKVIVISSSDHISEKDNYGLFREKVINKKCNFSYSFEQTINLIKKTSTNKFIKDEISWVGQMVKEVLADKISSIRKGINLRTLFSVLANYETLEKNLLHIISKEQLNKEQQIRFQKNIFLNTLILTNEYRSNGISEKDLDQLDHLYYGIDFKKIMESIETPLSTEKEEMKEEKITKAEQLQNKYNKKSEEFKKELLFHPEITTYIFSGELKPEEIYPRWKTRFYPEPKEKRSLMQLHNFTKMSEADLKIIQRNCYSEALNGMYELRSIIQIMSFFFAMDSYNILWIEKDYEMKLFDAMKKSFDPEDLSFFVGMDDLRDLFYEKDQKYYQEFLDYKDQKIKEYKEEAQYDRIIDQLSNKNFKFDNHPTLAHFRNTSIKSVIATIIDMDIINDNELGIPAKTLEMKNLLENDSSFLGSIRNKEVKVSEVAMLYYQVAYKKNCLISEGRLDDMDTFRLKLLFNAIRRIYIDVKKSS